MVCEGNKPDAGATGGLYSSRIVALGWLVPQTITTFVLIRYWNPHYITTVFMMVNLLSISVSLYECKNTKLWECDVYMKILNKFSKLQPRSKKVKFVGYYPETNSIIISQDVIFNKKLDQISINSLTEAKYIELLEKYNYIDLLNGWQHKLLAYLVKKKPEIMKKLTDSKLEALELIYLSKKQEILLHATEKEETNEAELSVLIKKKSQIQILSGKWVFNRKLNNMGGIVSFKAYWVIHEFKQQESVHYKKTYIAVVSKPTTRVFFTISIVKN
ncbi:conserved hypothetical protein [Coccidioides posadasii str. Silveira]|uniref:Uncharacterized protein n=1 Tax=Coccidioides posadasii (strain RMSCC 757 / Silveira) TaxID=443226 RepID=E9D7B1_COCPS|nr:conserved hypothetical protein [Coccidioides posadasii str. Silveira]